MEIFKENSILIGALDPFNNSDLIEDLEPVVIDIPPTITARDIGQTMIYVYDSVR